MDGGNCCCSLKTGVSVIGWLGLITVIPQIIDAIDPENSIMFQNSRESSFSVLFQKEADLLVFVTAFYANSAVIELIINIALLYAVSERKQMFMLPWLIMRIIYILTVFSITFVGFLYLCTSREKYAVRSGFGILFMGGLVGGPIIWLWSCVSRLYKEYKHETYQPKKLTA